ncbi:MAG: hypothetical protein R6V03_08565 [Kiritimatiellia bacterium]
MDDKEKEVIEGLTEAGGRLTSDLGLGRIVGKVAVYLYLVDEKRSLDAVADDLALSKASVSIAGRQLEALGVIQRVFRSGDRRNYYRIAEHVGVALQERLIDMVRRRVRSLSLELGRAGNSLSKTGLSRGVKPRVDRAKKACDRIGSLFDSPVSGLLRRFIK